MRRGLSGQTGVGLDIEFIILTQGTLDTGQDIHHPMRLLQALDAFLSLSSGKHLLFTKHPCHR